MKQSHVRTTELVRKPRNHTTELVDVEYNVRYQ